MFTLNTLQLYRGGRSLRAMEHSPLNATNGGAMGESSPRRIGKFYSSLSTFFCKLFIFFVERMTEN